MKCVRSDRVSVCCWTIFCAQNFVSEVLVEEITATSSQPGID